VLPGTITGNETGTETDPGSLHDAVTSMHGLVARVVWLLNQPTSIDLADHALVLVPESNANVRVVIDGQTDVRYATQPDRAPFVLELHTQDRRCMTLLQFCLTVFGERRSGAPVTEFCTRIRLRAEGTFHSVGVRHRIGVTQVHSQRGGIPCA
jgi:hypothetical protein